MAEEKPYLTGRTYIFRLAKGKDLLEQLTDFCHENQVKCGVISGIGALENATITFFDQAKKKYDKIALTGEQELLSLNGNVSIKDNRPFVHAHVVLGDKTGKAAGGHLALGSKVFSAEVFIQELVGEPKVRKEDKATKLMLWI
jgi:predicted DNA-binding protein with PD1-like motif